MEGREAMPVVTVMSGSIILERRTKISLSSLEKFLRYDAWTFWSAANILTLSYNKCGKLATYFRPFLMVISRRLQRFFVTPKSLPVKKIWNVCTLL